MSQISKRIPKEEIKPKRVVPAGNGSLATFGGILEIWIQLRRGVID
ncbi:hypothetical protein MKZ25_03335 [Solibacillus sp. FSL W7-1464]